jgi:tetratricopeptide (TPR) repeat protein
MEPNAPEMLNNPPADEAPTAKISLLKRGPPAPAVEEAPAAVEEAPAPKVSLLKRDDTPTNEAGSGKVSLFKSEYVDEIADDEEDEEEDDLDFEAEEETDAPAKVSLRKESAEPEEEEEYVPMPYEGYGFDESFVLGEDFVPEIEDADEGATVVREPNPDAVVELIVKEELPATPNVGRLLGALGVIIAGLAIISLLFTNLIFPFGAKLHAYNEAKDLLESGEYLDAAAAFKNLGGFLNAEEMVEESYEQKRMSDYNYAIALREAGNYDEAMAEFEYLGDYSDSKQQYCQTAYEYGNYLMGIGDYYNAIELYALSENYSDAKQQTSEAYYQLGKKQMENEAYLEALESFKHCSGHADVDNLVLQAKLGYVKAYPDVSDKNTAAFVQELEESGMEGIEELLTEVYKWKVTIVAFNNDIYNSTTNKSSISKNKAMCAHFKVTGGKVGETVNLRAEMVLPNGVKGNIPFENAKNGDILVAYGTYDNPTYGKTGTLTIKIYDANNNLLAEGEVRVY